MDLKDKKLAIIDSILNNQDENILDEISLLLLPHSLSKLTKQDIINRAEKAEQDYHNGKVYSTAELLKIAEKW